MIVLDTHVWVWWVHGDAKLPSAYQSYIQVEEQHGLAVSAISCWEVAKLVERSRLQLPCALETWLQQALSYPGVQLIPLSPEIAIESTQLPGRFQRDPADQIIVATARRLDCPLVTLDSDILAYPHVKLAALGAP